MGGSLLAALSLALIAQGSREKRIEEFKEERTRVLIECGERHLDYALELRKKGLVVQSAAQLVQAVEVAEGKHEGANLVLTLMRRYDDAFWKRRVKKVPAARIEAYEKKARKLRLEDQAERLALVRRAYAHELEAQAHEELRRLLLALDEPLVFDAKGTLVLPGGTIAGTLATRVRDEAILVNGQPYVRDRFLERMPELARIHEATSPLLRVRTTTSMAEAEDLLAAGSALFAQLGAELGAVPDRRLQLCVLAEREPFDRYLDLAGLSSHKAADGFADRVTETALVCKQGSDEAHVLGLALHELVHLYQLAVTAATLPSWFLEGSAERFGGEGTFRWDGQTLVTGLALEAARLDAVRAEPFPLREFLAQDALELFRAPDRTGQQRFYAQAWAFVTFLESEAAGELGERYGDWRAMCFGSAIGTDFADPYASQESASRDLFLREFEPDLAELERAFLAWLMPAAAAPEKR